MKAITPIILYLQECASNRTLPNLLIVIIYDSAASLHHMEIFLNHLQALTYHPMAMLIPDIKAVNVLVHKILRMFSFEPSRVTKLQQSLMDNLLQSL